MNLVKKLKSSNMFKNVAKLSSGTVIGQLIAIVTLPILTQLYGVTVLGFWAVLYSVSNIVSSFSDLGLKNAILMENDENSERLYTVITTITTTISLLAAIITFLYYFYFGGQGVFDAGIIAMIVSVMIFSTCQIQTCYSWLNKMGKYNILMKNPIIQQSTIFVFTMIFYFVGLKEYGYYYGMVLGSVITLIVMKYNLPKKFLSFNISDYKYVIETKREFYFYQMPTNVLIQFKTQLPVFLITMFFGTDIVGYYSVSKKYLDAPISLLSAALGRVFLKEISERARNGKAIGNFAFRNLKRASYLMIIPMICIFTVGDIACKLMFGADFIVAGNIMRIVALIYCFQFLMNSCNGMTIVLSKQKQAMITSAAQMLAYVIGISLGYYFTNNIYISLTVTTILYSTLQVLFFSYLFKSCDIKPIKFYTVISKSMIIVFGVSIIIRLIMLYFGVVPNL